jgi:hypothetical protein
MYDCCNKVPICNSKIIFRVVNMYASHLFLMYALGLVWRLGVRLGLVWSLGAFFRVGFVGSFLFFFVFYFLYLEGLGSIPIDHYIPWLLVTSWFKYCFFFFFLCVCVFFNINKKNLNILYNTNLIQKSK